MPRKKNRGEEISEKQWFTTGDVAALLEVRSHTIKNYIKRGQIEASYLPSGYVRISRAEVIRFFHDLGRTIPGLTDVPIKKILILEDSDSRRRILYDGIRTDPRYLVKQAPNAVLGAGMAADMHPDVIVADLGLGSVRSDKAMAELRKHGLTNGARFLFYSAHLQKHESGDPGMVAGLKKDLGAEVMEWPESRAVSKIKTVLDSFFPELERRGSRV